MPSTKCSFAAKKSATWVSRCLSKAIQTPYRYLRTKDPQSSAINLETDASTAGQTKTELATLEGHLVAIATDA